MSGATALLIILAVMVAAWAVWVQARVAAADKALLKLLKHQRATREAMENVEVVSDPDLARVWLNDRAK